MLTDADCSILYCVLLHSNKIHRNICASGYNIHKTLCTVVCLTMMTVIASKTYCCSANVWTIWQQITYFSLQSEVLTVFMCVCACLQSLNDFIWKALILRHDSHWLPNWKIDWQEVFKIWKNHKNQWPRMDTFSVKWVN